MSDRERPDLCLVLTAHENGLMSKTVKGAGILSMAASVLILIFSATGSGAAAQDQIAQDHSAQGAAPAPAKSEPNDSKAGFASLDHGAASAARQDDADADGSAITASLPSTASLAQLVAVQPQVEQLSKDLNCLAGAIYLEARHSSFEGQLAVGQVIVSRTKSGRFPENYCGVVFQQGQFSFARGHSFPSIDTGSKSWHNAVAIAQIAHRGRWHPLADGALYFHSARIHPHWNRTRVAMVDGNVFYR